MHQGEEGREFAGYLAVAIVVGFAFQFVLLPGHAEAQLHTPRMLRPKIRLWMFSLTELSTKDLERFCRMVRMDVP